MSCGYEVRGVTLRQTGQVPTVSECLPRVAQFLPESDANRPVSDSPAAFIDLLLAVQLAASGKTIFGLTRVGEAAMDDLDHLSDEKLVHRAQVDAARVGVGTTIAVAECLSGNIDAARAWLVRGLGGTSAPESEFSLGGLAFLRVSAAVGNVTAVDVVAQFSYALFYVARATGYLREATDQVGSDLATELTRFPVTSTAVDAVPQALSWACSLDREDLAQPLRDWCNRAAESFDQRQFPALSSARRTAALELRFAVAVSLPEGPDRAAALDEALARVDGECPAELAVQVLAAAGGRDPVRTRDLMPQLLEMVVATRKEWESVFTTDQVDALRERALSTIGAPLTTLARDGDVANAATLLRAWIGVDEPLSAACADRIQLCLHGEEHTYAWAGGTCVAPVVVTSQQLSAAMNQALGSAVVATGPGAHNLPVPATGRIDRTAGIGFGETCRDLLALDSCPQFVAAVNPAALLIPAPGYRVPYQGLLAERGAAPAVWVSLQEPAADRWIGRALIAQGDTDLSGVEAELVAAVFAAAGIEVAQVSADEGGVVADRVNDALGSDEYDIIWIAAHGRQPDYEPMAAEISLPSGRRLTDHDLKVLPAGQTERRLLVLSSCDAAATMQASGLRARGLAAAAAGPLQAVVGHQWVVNERLAAAFGVLLAAAIAETRDFNEAFSHSMRWLQRPWSENADLLATYDLDAGRVKQLQGAVEFRDNILDFGAPAFYC